MKDNEKYFRYLTKLRDIGSINMMQSPLFLSAEFKLTLKEAQDIFILWTESLDKGEKNEI